MTEKRKFKMMSLCDELEYLFENICQIEGYEKKIHVKYEYNEETGDEYIICLIGQGKYRTNVTSDSIKCAMQEVVRDVALKL